MFLRPQLPETPTPNLPTTGQHAHVPACGCQHSAPLAPPPRSLPSVGSGAVAAVVVGGVVVVALLAAVVVTAVSVAVAAVVLRSLLGAQHRRR
ncbi:hypothetical protein [Streptomyces sp. NPDC007083]|uniref:hypothetical protein n=1 Tax=Streptomyces sp. NPDC007083 TaxID=3156913 RepID=UPI0033C3B5ED